MTDDVWREFFDSSAPLYMNEVFTADRACGAAFLVDVLSRACRFTVEHVWGGTAGDWGRRPVDLDEMEVMVVLRRPPA